MRVSNEDAPRYRGRKNYPTINVLAACSFDMKFTYVLPGWEGTASDSRVMASALERNEDKLKLPEGKYYLIDAGYPLKAGLITPYRGKSTEPTYDVNTQVDIILACCIIHNYLMGMDPDESLINEVDRELLNETRNEEAGAAERSEDHSLGEYLRDSITSHMWHGCAKPAAEKWKTATISNYDKLLDLFGKDRARGFNALTAK
ncbi:protein ALP1-like [Cornus florida]|uniref:protein ALP1-like n=1 Tax=Cornus florida TaxID=4283 RepID=UPI00289AED54|nr:protein ALP1-like [Cornus florida]